MSTETALPVAPLSGASVANATITMLQKNSLTGAVQHEIERLIYVGELGPGDKLTEAALAGRLGVSRGPVREAFRVLEEVGLVQLEKNRGVFVRQISLAEALEIFDLRAMIEAHVGSALAAHATQAQIGMLRLLVTQMARAVKVADEATYYRLNVEFHEAMVSFAGNQKLIAMYRKLTRELSLFRRRNFSDHTILVTSVNEHREILDAIASGNAAKAAEALRQHVLMSRERTIQNDIHYAERAAPSKETSCK
jgi:phosphonate utilization transcriptional regulator